MEINLFKKLLLNNLIMQSMKKLYLLIIFFNCLNVRAQWVQIEEPDSSDLCFRAIQFPAKDTGFVANHNGIYKTVDGGVSWIYTNIEGSFSKIDFIGVDTGIVCCGITGGENLIRTYNGGETWQFPSQFYIVAQDVELLPNGDIFMVENAGDVLLHHFTDFYNNYVDSEFWQGYGNDIDFPSENIGYISGYIDNFDSASVVIRSFDGGFNWYNTLPSADGPENEISFPTPEIGYGRGHVKNQIWKSTDSGFTWELLPFEFRPDLDPIAVSIVKIYFFNDTVGYAGIQTFPEPFVYHYQVFRTMDGGVSWDSTSFSEDDIGPTDIYCTDPLTCYLTTCGGGIYKTTNGGGNLDTTIIINQLNEVNPLKSLNVYPNPAKNKIIIAINNPLNINSSSNISICDLSGKNILQIEIKSIETEIDVSQFAAGIYFVKIFLNGNNFIQPLMIE